MSQNQISKGRLRLRIALIVLAALAGLVVLATFGSDLPFSPFAPVDLRDPTIVDTDGVHTAIVDSESRNVLILNKDRKLTGIIDCGKLNSPIEAVTNVCVADKVLYVAGVKFQEDSDIIVQERVVAYDMRGGAEAVVFDLPVDNQQNSCIKAMDSMGNDVDVVMVTQETAQDNGYRTQSNIKIVRVNRHEKQETSNQTLYLPFVHHVRHACHHKFARRFGRYARVQPERGLQWGRNGQGGS